MRVGPRSGAAGGHGNLAGEGGFADLLWADPGIARLLSAGEIEVILDPAAALIHLAEARERLDRPCGEDRREDLSVLC